MHKLTSRPPEKVWGVVSQNFNIILKELTMTKKPKLFKNSRCKKSVAADAAPTSIEETTRIVILRMNGGYQLVGDFDSMAASHQAVTIHTAGFLLFDAIEKKDLKAFQELYSFMKNDLHVDIENFSRMLPNPDGKPGSFMSSICSAAVYFEALQIAEQIFRFSLFDDPLATFETKSSPLVLLNAFTYLIAQCGGSSCIPAYMKLAENFIKTYFESLAFHLPAALHSESKHMNFIRDELEHLDVVGLIFEQYRSSYHFRSLSGEIFSSAMPGGPLLPI